MSQPIATDENSLAAPTTSAEPSVSEALSALSDPPGPGELEEVIVRSVREDVPAWADYLEKPHSAIVLQILVRQLGSLRCPEVTPLLLKFADSAIVRTRANLLEGLELNGDPATIPVIIGFLKDEDKRVQANAVKALKSFPIASIVTEIRHMTEDSRSKIRESAILVLKGLKSPEGTSLLEKLLHDEESSIRKNAIRALAHQGRQENSTVLEAFFQTSIDPEEHYLVTKALDFLKAEKQKNDLPNS
ncbi:MAG: HEAT repeat domain-containing protein [Candidatus Ozemobacteraceae bacterium]